MNNIDELVNFIFTSYPKEPRSIQVEFDSDGNTTKDIFELLLLILKGGIKLIYNTEQVNLDDITDNNVFLLNQYFNSFGFKIYYIQINNLEINYTSVLDTNYLNDIDNLDDDVLPNILNTYNNITEVDQNFDPNDTISTEILSKSLDDFTSINTDKLTNYFINLKSLHNKYKLYFDFL
jgi:hypothetical protein